MRKLGVLGLLSVCGIALVAALLVGGSPLARAQDADAGTPAATQSQDSPRQGQSVVVAVAVIVVPECPPGYDPVEAHPAATPGGGGGAGGAGGVAFAIAAAPECAGGGSVTEMGTPVP